jgi:hypothetical protein
VFALLPFADLSFFAPHPTPGGRTIQVRWDCGRGIPSPIRIAMEAQARWHRELAGSPCWRTVIHLRTVSEVGDTRVPRMAVGAPWVHVRLHLVFSPLHRAGAHPPKTTHVPCGRIG